MGGDEKQDTAVQVGVGKTQATRSASPDTLAGGSRLYLKPHRPRITLLAAPPRPTLHLSPTRRRDRAKGLEWEGGLRSRLRANRAHTFAVFETRSSPLPCPVGRTLQWCCLGFGTCLVACE